MGHRADSVDRAIVDLLIEDGRMSCTEIARRIGHVSERSVRYRIDRLVKEGVIRISAVVSPRSVGFPITADVFIDVEPGRIMDVARRLMKFDCVSYVACSTGENDVSIQIVARNNDELYDFVTRVVAAVSGVRKTTTVLLPVILKDVYQWSIPAGQCADVAPTQHATPKRKT
jgi:Lrp/AsnC family transcriptional regulator for asnA, asnC and gidA